MLRLADSLTQKNRLPDLVFAPTLAFTRFSEDLLLRYAMITARTPAQRFTWILLPAPGLDFQPQTQDGSFNFSPDQVNLQVLLRQEYHMRVCPALPGQERGPPLPLLPLRPRRSPSESHR